MFKLEKRMFVINYTVSAYDNQRIALNALMGDLNKVQERNKRNWSFSQELELVSKSSLTSKWVGSHLLHPLKELEPLETSWSRK